MDDIVGWCQEYMKRFGLSREHAWFRKMRKENQMRNQLTRRPCSDSDMLQCLINCCTCIIIIIIIINRDSPGKWPL